MRDYLTSAILALKPNAEFSFINEDYSTIQWDILEGDAPTKAEIDAAIKQIKQDESAAQTKAETDKLAAQAKLTALGLTADDLKALGL
jgi:hypothetical protein